MDCKAFSEQLMEYTFETLSPEDERACDEHLIDCPDCVRRYLKLRRSVEDVASKMSEAQVRRLPVIDDSEKLIGIVSLGDLSRETDGETAHHALEGVSAPGGQHQQ